MKDFVKRVLLVTIFALVILHFGKIIEGAGVLLQIVTPLVLGGVIAFVLNIFVSRLEKIYFPKSQNNIIKKTRRPLSIILSLVIIVAIFAGIIMIVVPELARSFSLIVKEVPAVAEDILAWLDKNAANIPMLKQYFVELQESWPEIVENVSEYVRKGMSGLFTSVLGVIGAVTSGVVNSVIGFIFACYILANKEKLAAQISRLLKAYVPVDKVKKIKYVCETLNECFANFIVGQCTEAVIIGILCAVGMNIFDFPYAGMIGTVIGATALIPMVGAYIGAFVGAFLILTVNPFQALLFLIFIVVLQQLEGNFIYPKVVGSSIGLPGMWVLVAVTLGGGVAGIAGMLIGVPVAASAYKLVSKDVNKRLTDKQETGRQGADRKLSDEQESDEKPSDSQPSDEQQSDEKSSGQPSDKRTTGNKGASNKKRVKKRRK